MKLNNYKPTGKGSYTRLIVDCTFYDNCQRTRVTNRTAMHGAIEPIAYLSAWSKLGSEFSKERHCARIVRGHATDASRETMSLGKRAQPVLDVWRYALKTRTTYR